MAEDSAMPDVVLVEDDEAGRAAQGMVAQGRNKMPRLANGGGEGSTGAASSSSGAPGALALATNSGGLPEGETRVASSAVVLGPRTDNALQPFWNSSKWHTEWSGESIDTISSEFSFWLSGGSEYLTISADDR